MQAVASYQSIALQATEKLIVRLILGGAAVHRCDQGLFPE